MSRAATPRRSTRSQSRDLDGGNGVLSDDEVSIASSSAVRAKAVSRRKSKAVKAALEREETIEEETTTTTIETEAQASSRRTPAQVASQTTNGTTLHTHAIKALPRNALRRRILHALGRLAYRIPSLPPILLLVSLLLVIALPTPEKPFRRNVYVDENALQPGSASVDWNWGEVEFADQVSERVKAVVSARSEVRAAFLSHELRQIGFVPYNQSYRFTIPTSNGVKELRGINTYARWSAARGDGREAFVIAVPWKSAWNGKDDPDQRADGVVPSTQTFAEGAMSRYEREQVRRANVRGVATALAAARYLSAFRHWSKDLIFVFGDGELHGMQAWTSQYFGRKQKNLEADTLHGSGSLVWNALAIDYPADSFSHLVIKHEGLDGQLPNMDMISTLTHISHRAGGIYVTLPASTEYDWSERPVGQLGDLLEEHIFRSGDGARKYLSGLWNAAYQVGRLSLGSPSGVHGLFLKYHVDAITIFAQPASGPFGFWHMGRAVDSMAHSMSNLLERLHHSHFFYILTSPDRFIEVAKYMPVAALFSAALLIAGIAAWLEEGARARRRQDVMIKEVKLAVANEEVEDNTEVGTSPRKTLINGGHALTATQDVHLRDPSVAQRTSAVIAVLVQRSTRKGDLVSTAKVRSMAGLLDVHGRPAGAALSIVMAAHAMGIATLCHLSTAPVNCAKNGLENCVALGTSALALAACVVFLTALVVRQSKQHVLKPIIASQSFLPDEAIETLNRLRTFRSGSVARTAIAIAMMEAGIVTLVISIVNFSLAAVLGAVLSVSLCLAGNVFPLGDDEDDKRKAIISPTPPSQHIRQLTPASGYSNAVEQVLPATRGGGGGGGKSTSFRVGMTVQSIAFLALTPSFALPIGKALQWYALRLFAPSPHAPSWVTDPSVFARLLDGVLWEYHILSSALLPILSLVFVPIMLVGATSSLVVAAAA